MVECDGGTPRCCYCCYDLSKLMVLLSSRHEISHSTSKHNYHHPDRALSWSATTAGAVSPCLGSILIMGILSARQQQQHQNTLNSFTQQKNSSLHLFLCSDAEECCWQILFFVISEGMRLFIIKQLKLEKFLLTLQPVQSLLTRDYS